MANTGNLKIIEERLIENFCSGKKCEAVKLAQKEKLKVFDHMLPDLVAYECGTLHIGEITTSGYYGKNNKDFHLGATRKLGEAFVKLYIYKKEIKNIIERLREKFPSYEINRVEYHFIVPQGSRFIKGLGYRQKLFDDDIKLTEVPLSVEDLEILKEVNDRARREIKKREVDV